MRQSKKSVLLADDHPELLVEVRQLVATVFNVVGTVGDGQALVELADALKPDVVVTDLRMPRLSGIDAARTILEHETCKAIVLLTVYDNPRLIETALEAGVLGYVLKATAGEELIPAIEAALQGAVFISRRIQHPNRRQKGV